MRVSISECERVGWCKSEQKEKLQTHECEVRRMLMFLFTKMGGDKKKVSSFNKQDSYVYLRLEILIKKANRAIGGRLNL